MKSGILNTVLSTISLEMRSGEIIRNIDYVYKRLNKLGVKFISKPIKSFDSRSKICLGRDPDGYLIEFIEDLKDR